MIKVLIAAMDLYNGIGKQGKLPWKIPLEMKLFKQKTTGYHLLMGRKTFDSVGSLSDRFIFVLTRNKKLKSHQQNNYIYINKIEEIEKYSGIEKLFICGGAEIYRKTLFNCDYLDISIIQEKYDCDTKMPKIPYERFELLTYKFYTTDKNNLPNFYNYRWKKR